MAGLVELRGVGKRYNRSRTVLDDIDLVIYPGEIVGVVGGNGSGKSTLLRIVAGLSPVTSGRVIARPRVVGYVPERFPTQARISARSYLKHIGRIKGLSTRAALTRADELLTRLALVGGAESELRRLSKGNAQKVAVAQALMVPPQLLVLDEPWSGLDAAAHEVLAELIDETAREGGAVMFTDHREAVVSASASVIYRISGGRLSTAPSGEAVAFLELVDAALDAPEPDWWRLPGVLEARREDAVVRLEVVSKYADELMFQALGNGWSVQSVRRSAPVPVREPRDEEELGDVEAGDERYPGDGPGPAGSHDLRDDHDPDDARDDHGKRDAQDQRAGGEARGEHDGRAARGERDGRAARGERDGRDPRDQPGDREQREARDSPAPRDARDQRAPRDEHAARGEHDEPASRDRRGGSGADEGPDRPARTDGAGWGDGRSRTTPAGDAWQAADARDDDEPAPPVKKPRPRPNLTLVKDTGGESATEEAR